MSIPDLTRIKNPELSRLSLSIALDIADAADDLEYIVGEDDPDERRAVKRRAREYAEHAVHYDERLAEICTGGSLSAQEKIAVRFLEQQTKQLASAAELIRKMPSVKA